MHASNNASFLKRDRRVVVQSPPPCHAAISTDVRYSPAVRHQRNRPAHPDARQLDQAQRSFEGALKLLMRWYHASMEDVQRAVSRLDLTALQPVNKWRSLCQKLYPDNCQRGRYRSLDGSCNNLAQPAWGKALTCHSRMGGPIYDDGVSAPRTRGKSGNKLPNSRLVSIAMRTSPPDPSYKRYASHLFMAYGQIVDHDMSLSPDSRGANGTLLQCCGDKASPACFPIKLSPDDPFFVPLGIRCLNVVRSSSCTDCSGFHERRLVNQQSAFLDASIVYGTSEEVLRTLRDPSNPELMLMPKGILPPSLNPDADGCSDPRSNQFCFRAGDGRVNQQPGIASLQILYARQHNRLAKELRRLHPHWEPEIVFQEARRILIAQHQHMIYSEFIPMMLGPLHSAALGLSSGMELHPTGVWRSKYEPKRDPRIMVEFTTAAYRFGHGLIDDFSLVDHHGGVAPYSLSDRFFNVQEFYNKGTVEQFHRGLCLQPGRGLGPALDDSVRQHLYRNSTSQAGLDLASVNVQRGRDHGIPGYGFWLRRCLGREVHSFEQLKGLVPPERIQLLQSIYEHPDDVDLWTAGLMEYPAESRALVGPTFACIIGRQFRSLKYGDRYFYTHDKGPNVNPLSDAQISEIAKFSIAKLFCANADDPDRFFVQPLALIQPDPRSNPLLNCKDLPDTDLSNWAPADLPEEFVQLPHDDFFKQTLK
ncbi:chorion peroxidase-like [Ixodes scapularis]|uniref:chorion peroxidase-like n=1 Tax=Ixodes scapularis TaxID=6945 RepID=UPI001AD69945|nr:chorion peroxidase-like [Ixodes scapularis]